MRESAIRTRQPCGTLFHRPTPQSTINTMQRAVPLFRASAFAARVPARALHIRPAGLAGASPAQSHRVIVGKQQQLFQHRFLTNAAAWKQHKDVSYEELKPITEQPNDVSLRVPPARADLLTFPASQQDIVIIGTNIAKLAHGDSTDFLFQYL